MQPVCLQGLMYTCTILLLCTVNWICNFCWINCSDLQVIILIVNTFLVSLNFSIAHGAQTHTIFPEINAWVLISNFG